MTSGQTVDRGVMDFPKHRIFVVPSVSTELIRNFPRLFHFIRCGIPA
jgi:hypothetical protein